MLKNRQKNIHQITLGNAIPRKFYSEHDLHMRIGIDARFAGHGGQGLGRYTAELIYALAEIDSDNTYAILTRQRDFWRTLPKNFSLVETSIPWYGMQEHIGIPRLIKEQDIHLMHFVHFNVPYRCPVPYIVTIHDLILRRFSSAHATTRSWPVFAVKYAAYRIGLRNALKNASRIVTVSNASALDIEHFYPFAKKKISVIYEAPTASTIVKEDPALPVSEPFFLHVGNAYPHKNLRYCIDEFVRFNEQNRTYHLALVGKRDVFYERLIRHAEQYRNAQILFLGEVGDETLSSLYRHATAYVSPSLCEGFDLPSTEAALRGIPVVASDIPVHREILGSAALFFPAEKKGALSESLQLIIASQPLRSELTEAGQQHVRQYSWKLAAQQTLELYKSMLNSV